MKKILLSLATLVVVGGMAAGLTIAFYNDTETSTGNIFTAGSIDLKVDHTYASYLGEECVGECEETGDNLIVNGGFEQPVPTANGGQWEVYPTGILGWDVVDGSGIEIQRNGVAGAPHSGNQLAELDSHTPGSSQSSVEQVINTVPGQKYRLKFWHSPRPNNGPDTDNAIALDIEVTSNSGTLVDDTIGQPSFSGSGTVWTQYVYNFIALDTQTTIRFTDAGTQSDTLGGYLDDVSVRQLDCSGNNYPYGGMCTLWGEKDLQGGDSFWYFPDIKPGDWGRNIISLHVYSNDSFACLLPSNVEDDENTLIEPEATAGDNTDPEGELGSNIEFFMWVDENANNTYENGEEILLEAGTPFNQIQTELIQLSLVGNAPVTLVGIDWCAGDQTGPTISSPNTALDCDGSGMTDVVQTDMLTADFVAYAVQQRNNEGFSCAEVDLDE